MESVVVYLAIWGAVIVVANKHYKHHMASYGLDTKGQQVSHAPHFHRRHDD